MDTILTALLYANFNPEELNRILNFLKIKCLQYLFQGRGLVAAHGFKKGDVLFEEKPLVSAQFSWNELYKYLACEFCLKSLESAEEMVRRLANNQGLSLPHPECCDVDPSAFTQCPNCQVFILTYTGNIFYDNNLSKLVKFV